MTITPRSESILLRPLCFPSLVCCRRRCPFKPCGFRRRPGHRKRPCRRRLRKKIPSQPSAFDSSRSTKRNSQIMNCPDTRPAVITTRGPSPANIPLIPISLPKTKSLEKALPFPPPPLLIWDKSESPGWEKTAAAAPAKMPHPRSEVVLRSLESATFCDCSGPRALESCSCANSLTAGGQGRVQCLAPQDAEDKALVPVNWPTA